MPTRKPYRREQEVKTKAWLAEQPDRTDQHGMHAHTLIMHRQCERCRELGHQFDTLRGLLRDARRLAA